MARNRIPALASTVASAFSAAAAVATMNAAVAQADIVGDFKTPSGNIYCQMAVRPSDGVAAVACEGGGPQAGPEPDCAEQFPWGDRLSIIQGQAPESDCHTDTIRSNQAQAPVLEYGQTKSIGTITCDSETTGLTCTDASTGHFFVMSREANSLG